MHQIVYYIIIFLIIGAIGMSIANKKAESKVRQQRWLKYFTYIFITGTVVLAIFFNFIIWVGAIIVIASLLELLGVNFFRNRIPFLQIILSLLFFSIISVGFMFFVGSFNYSFLLFIYFQVLVFDGFCQITGQIFGKHQLAPQISIAKTVEGLIGGWLFCLIAAILAANWINISLPVAILYGILTGLSSFAGDILASWYKRKVNVKDYSKWLPGQGGFLDRFDSFLMAGSIYYLLYMTIFKDRLVAFVN
ncbi:MAG TPA: phosphatidate cytidylyltransferase [Chitinophagaceae bacterium]|nr:phosphatidate cytidylyltransferase [Chitinophagaceae bacterium]